jgi:hypothetical protein
LGPNGGKNGVYFVVPMEVDYEEFVYSMTLNFKDAALS